MTDHTEALARLAADAEYFRPQLFAVYGVSKEIAGILPPTPFLGWGIDLGERQGAVYWDPQSKVIHEADSAEQVLATHLRTGDAHLTWLDD